MTLRSQTICVLGLAVLFPSLLITLDLGLSLLCTRAPLSWYLGACAIGVAVAPLLGPKLLGNGTLRRLLRALISFAIVLGLIGAAWMTIANPAEGGFGFPPSWNSKCAWRYCGRAIGPGLNRSPFPVGKPSCNALRMCANEYPYSDDENQQLLNLMRAESCPLP